MRNTNSLQVLAHLVTKHQPSPPPAEHLVPHLSQEARHKYCIVCGRRGMPSQQGTALTPFASVVVRSEVYTNAMVLSLPCVPLPCSLHLPYSPVLCAQIYADNHWHNPFFGELCSQTAAA